MSSALEMQAREKQGDQLREAAQWRLYRSTARPSPSPTRPERERRLTLRRGR